ncbi:hypothetical protein SLS61_003630 [Didymella pomorum]
MESDQLESLFEPGKSTTPLPSDNDVEVIKSPQAFEEYWSQVVVAAERTEEVYDPEQEPLPDHPYFSLDVPTLHGKIDAALEDLWISLQGF